ncbi:MAG: pilus assembly protein PilP [Desulfobacteraceae bacterium]|nr:pilus assembly protein PilP [Desulfobacteraceae bacterium]
MDKKHAIKVTSACFVLSLLILTGCETRTKTARNPEVVKKKIVVAQADNRSVAVAQTDTGAGSPGAITLDKTADGLEINTLETAELYNPEGKTDPFAPLFREEPVAASGALAVKTQRAQQRIPLTPLEMVDLSQLKLVGILRADSGNKALVEESNGKGYVVKKGVYLGSRGGRLEKILKDSIVVYEPLLPVHEVDEKSIYDVEGKNFSIFEAEGKKFANVDGKKFEALVSTIDGKAFFVDPKELKLQKPAGE